MRRVGWERVDELVVVIIGIVGMGVCVCVCVGVSVMWMCVCVLLRTRYSGVGGSVVECSPATRAARVRFPADAYHF